MTDPSDEPRLTRVAAYGLIVLDERILLCRIAPWSSHTGHWTLPGGGIDFGEDPEAAMIREVREETGFDVEPEQIVGIDSVVTPANQGGQIQGVRIVYRARIIGGEQRNEIDGSTDMCQWWSRPAAGDLPLVDLVQRFIDVAFGVARR